MNGVSRRQWGVPASRPRPRPPPTSRSCGQWPRGRGGLSGLSHVSACMKSVPGCTGLGGRGVRGESGSAGRSPRGGLVWGGSCERRGGGGVGGGGRARQATAARGRGASSPPAPAGPRLRNPRQPRLSRCCGDGPGQAGPRGFGLVPPPGGGRVGALPNRERGRLGHAPRPPFSR